MVKKITILKALEPFLTKPEEKLHLASVSKEIKEPHPTVRLWLNELEKRGILKKQHQGRLTLYCLNDQSPNIVEFLVMAEKGKLTEKCEKWPLLGELVYFMHRNMDEDSKMLIFGSSADSFASANDLDILIVGKSDFMLTSFAKRLGYDTHIINVKITSSVHYRINPVNIIFNNSLFRNFPKTNLLK